MARQGLQMENPQLVTSYYDLHRHSLSTVLSLLAHDSIVAVAFPAPMLQSTSGMQTDIIEYEPRLSAYGCAGLQNAGSRSAIRGLSYPEPPDFSGWRTFQVSPQVPAALLRPHQPSSPEPVLLLPYSPGANPARVLSRAGRFHFMTGRYAEHTAVSWSPSTPGRAGNV